MADPITSTPSVYSITITYDGTGTPTGVQVRYARVFTDTITNQTWSIQLGPLEVSPTAHPNLLNQLLLAMPPSL